MPTDLRHAVRSLSRSPALAATAMISLALGIGLNVTVYSVVREMILDNLSARRPDRLVRLGGAVTWAQYRDLRDAAVLEALAFDTGLGDVTWKTGATGQVAWRMGTSANFFDVLGVAAAAGRLYTQADEGRPVAVASYGFWRRRLEADPAAIGRPLQLGGRLYTLLGVLPPDYRSILGHAVSPEVYLPAPPDSRSCHAFGRLKDGVTAEQARQALAAAAERIGGADFARRIAVVRPMAGLAANAAGQGDDRRFFLFFAMLFGTAAALALIACGNVAGLLLSRGLTRRRELAIRKALGAGRRQLARPAFAEAVVLVAGATAAGLLADAWLRSWLRSVRWPSAYLLPLEFHFQSDRGLFLYALLAAVVALIMSSLAPTLRGSDANLNLAIKQGEPAFSVRRWSLRHTFVTAQVALSMVLLAVGLLFLRGFLRLAGENPGFDAAHTLVAVVYGPTGRPDARDALARRLRAVPGVMGVTSIGTLPFMGELPRDVVRRAGDPEPAARDAYTLGAGEQFCHVLGIPILRGRDFDIADRQRRPAPVLVNRTLARQLFGDADPVGARLVVGRGSQRVLEIVGVAADARMRTLGEAPAPMFFTFWAEPQLLVRTAGDPAQWIRPVRDALAEADTASALDVRPLSEATAGALFPMRVAAGFVGGLSALGLLLVLSGVYSAVSYATRQRTREMAIRAALGAGRARILWAAIRDGVAVLACGVVFGLPLAIAAIRPLTDLLPDGLNPWQPAMFAGSALLLLGAGAAAAWIPARAAAGADPARALRQE